MSDQGEDEKRIDKAIEVLSEFFDTVQVFCSRDSSKGDGATVHITRGSGNFMARAYHVHQWVVRNDERTRIDCRKDNEDD